VEREDPWSEDTTPEERIVDRIDNYFEAWNETSAGGCVPARIAKPLGAASCVPKSAAVIDRLDKRSSGPAACTSASAS